MKASSRPRRVCSYHTQSGTTSRPCRVDFRVSTTSTRATTCAILKLWPQRRAHNCGPQQGCNCIGRHGIGLIYLQKQLFIGTAPKRDGKGSSNPKSYFMKMRNTMCGIPEGQGPSLFNNLFMTRPGVERATVTSGEDLTCDYISLATSPLPVR